MVLLLELHSLFPAEMLVVDEAYVALAWTGSQVLVMARRLLLLLLPRLRLLVQEVVPVELPSGAALCAVSGEPAAPAAGSSAARLVSGDGDGDVLSVTAASMPICAAAGGPSGVEVHGRVLQGSVGHCGPGMRFIEVRGWSVDIDSARTCSDGNKAVK